MSPFHLMTVLVLCCGKVVFSEKVNEGLRNKHLTIIGEWWLPYFDYDLHENDKGGYEYSNFGGIMWELILFMQKARNFTFTMAVSSDGEWGSCHAQNNCTGMFGMVNRREVDLALGKCDFQFIN